MTLRFRGGERLQRGRGIGGLLRLVKSVFSPLVKSAGKTVIKAVKSDIRFSSPSSLKSSLT